MSDEPPTKVIAEFHSANGLLQPSDDETTNVYVSLCFDVLLELLQFGERRGLAKLERIGRRFHQSVENFFAVMPFLRLDLQIRPSDSGLEALISSGKNVPSLVDLNEFPAFLRFDEVYLPFNLGSQSITDKTQLFGDFLASIKGPIQDLKGIFFVGDINQTNPAQFTNHSAIIAYIRDEFLQICGSSRRYQFWIEFFSDKEASTTVAASILEMPEIVRCTSLSLQLHCIFAPIHLPVEAIAQWLNQNTERIEISGRLNGEKVLHIRTLYIGNVLEMCDHLTEAFKRATNPAPYTFLLEFYNEVDGLEEQLLPNNMTNEEFSIVKVSIVEENGMFQLVKRLAIQRTFKKKKN